MTLNKTSGSGSADLNVGITSDRIIDGEIVNADIASGAAIGKSKITSTGTFPWAEVSKSGSSSSATVDKSIGTIAVLAAAVTNYLGLNLVGLTATEALAQSMVGQAGTISGFSIKAVTNTLDVSALFTLRVNGAGTVISATIPAASTTLINSSGTAVSVVAGDLLSISVLTAAGLGTALNIGGFISQTITGTLA